MYELGMKFLTPVQNITGCREGSCMGKNLGLSHSFSSRVGNVMFISQNVINKTVSFLGTKFHSLV
jgi:hypothetical protein